ncbi:related to RAD16 - nucleotide excision repair protein [Melanopsichium pennsylvanicum]|uniref:Related to RAD16 - nucleotide excision repair protein n=2 Tax=Melanopsichium pennsylvanicum TaxID=63383 RepID=A0AAJ5C2V1_9BASI|nr:related to RAD16-nucleotide excision repair protein [Melanopsichium pennsylvanicum 4]SNX81913.1 related to RAD16 - nucleotide excision repair protein [Melanopsichium pennsylvanicum]
MLGHSRSPDALEEIDDASDLLSKPLEPLPLVPPPVAGSSTSLNVQTQIKRHLPPGFGTTSTSSNPTFHASRPTVWNPAKGHVPAAPAATFSANSAPNGLVIGGSGARVPTQFLDQNGGFSRPPPPHLAAAPASSNSHTSTDMPGAFPLAGANKAFSSKQPLPPTTSRNATIDLTLDSDDEKDDVKQIFTGTNGDGTVAARSNFSMPAASSSRPVQSQALATSASTSAPSSSHPVVTLNDEDDDDEPVIISHKRPTPEEFEIDHIKSNAIVCAGLINAVVLCMYGLPQSLTYAGTIADDPPEDFRYSRENWPIASRFWTQKGYRPLALRLSNPVNLPLQTRSLPGGWIYNPASHQKPDINVSVLVPPLVSHPNLSPDQAKVRGHSIEPSFGSLAEKYVQAMEPLLRSNKIRCEARCRMVPISRAQNFLHYLEILVFARRPDLALVSERLAAFGIQLEHPPSYHPEDYPTEPQYSNPHNPPLGGVRNDAALQAYSGIYRGDGFGTSVQNRELTEKEKKAQVDAVYSSIRSGEELAAVEPVALISTKLLQHQKQALGFLLTREKDRRWPELLMEKQNKDGSPSGNDRKPRREAAKAEPAEGHGDAPGSSRAAQKARAKEEEMQEAIEEDSISLWKVRKGLNGQVRAWRNLITNRETMTQPRICRGAILADDMGLGKTITTLALIAHTIHDARTFGATKVQRDIDVELALAMKSIEASDKLSSPKKEEEEDVPAASRSKRRLPDSSHDSDMDSCDEDDSDYDATPPISLALHNAPPASKSNGKRKKPKKEKVDPEIVRRKHLECRSRATLIVCPLSVVSNWEEQFKEHWTRRKQPSIYIYHGPQRATNIRRIANHDIVLTTYSTLGSEFSNQTTWVAEDSGESKKRGKQGSPSDSPDGDVAEGVFDDEEVFMIDGNGVPIEREVTKNGDNGRNGKKQRRKPAKEALNPLQRIEWFRIVLDEAHTIKGASTWQSKAACNLSAQRRLCLTGTPIQNSINDLFALVKFLRLDPFTERVTWNEFCGFREAAHLKSKAKDNDPIDTANVGHVQILMKFLALRRQKTSKTADGKQILSLPPKLSKTEYLEFEESEKARYQALHERYREDFEEMMDKDTVNNNYATILHEILNLRMTCDHPSMVDASKDAKRRGRGADLSEAIKQDGLSRERAAILFILFRDSEMAYCSECQADLSANVDRDTAGNEAQELSDALDAAASDSRNGKRPTKRTRIEPGMRSEATSATMSRNGLDPPSEDGPRPVVTRCQHIFCSSCFRHTIGYPWPNVTASDVGHCPTCRTSLKLAIDAIELEPIDFIGLNDDQAERIADGVDDFIDHDLRRDTKSKKSMDRDAEVDQLQDDFDWGSGDEKKQVIAPRENEKAADVPSHVRGDFSLEGRKDLSTKIRALVTDLIPFSKCNPHSALYNPTAPRLVHIDPSTSEDAEIRKVEDPVVVIQRPPPAITSSGLLGKLDQSIEALDSYEPVKSVVFSQWTKMLDRIQKSLSITGIRMARLDGTMKRPDRSAALEAFRIDPGIEVLLVSLRAGGTGLNLVTACRAYLMDPYWNPAVENQGLDRVHRMGQTRPVITTKYIMKQSIEENMLRLQKRKTMIAEKVGSKRQIGNVGSSREERREELKIMFGISNGGVEL